MADAQYGPLGYAAVVVEPSEPEEVPASSTAPELLPLDPPEPLLDPDPLLDPLPLELPLDPLLDPLPPELPPEPLPLDPVPPPEPLGD
jgi:protein TonB